MKEVQYKRVTSVKNHQRVIAIHEKSENKDVLTDIHRTFIYRISKKVSELTDVPAPEFHIIKNCNSKTKEEKFLLRVKGVFYVVRHEGFLLVNFCHSLRVNLLRKSVIPAV